jgi:biopolymer transport protein ExbB
MQVSQEFVILARLATELVFWLLFTINIASVAIIAERFWFFWRRRIDADQVARHLLNFLRLRDLPRARALLLRYNAPECTIVLAGMGELEHGRQAAVDAMKSARAREQIRMEVNLGALKAVAQSAPILGLLGTVLGVLSSMPDAGTTLIDRQNALSPALSGALAALSTTAGGLCVALPAMAASILFQRQVRLVLRRGEVLVHLVLAMAEREAAERLRDRGVPATSPTDAPVAGNANGRVAAGRQESAKAA